MNGYEGVFSILANKNSMSGTTRLYQHKKTTKKKKVSRPCHENVVTVPSAPLSELSPEEVNAQLQQDEAARRYITLTNHFFPGLPAVGSVNWPPAYVDPMTQGEFSVSRTEGFLVFDQIMSDEPDGYGWGCSMGADDDKVHIAIKDVSMLYLACAFEKVVAFIDKHNREQAELSPEERFSVWKFKFPAAHLAPGLWQRNGPGKFCTVYFDCKGTVDQLNEFAEKLDQSLAKAGFEPGTLATDNQNGRADISMGLRYVTYADSGIRAEQIEAKTYGAREAQERANGRTMARCFGGGR